MTDLNDLPQPECVPSFVSKTAFHRYSLSIYTGCKKLSCHILLKMWKPLLHTMQYLTDNILPWHLKFIPLYSFISFFSCIISRECLLPFLTMSFLSVSQQGSAHTDDAASLNNSHGGLPSSSSSSSTELNHQVEAFRGLMHLPHSYMAKTN